MQDLSLPGADLRLINALQINPRASWTSLSVVLGSDPATLARRWERLTRQGLAWIAAYTNGPDDGPVALVELQCDPGGSLAVAEQLRDDDEVLTVDLTTGNRDVLVTLATRDHAEISRFVLERMASVSGVRSLRTQVVTTALWDARRWRLRSLDAEEVKLITEACGSRPGRRVSVGTDEIHALREQLHMDARIPLNRLADRLGVARGKAKRMLETVLAEGRLVMRTEVARQYSGWPIYIWFFLNVSGQDRNLVAARLARLRETRFAGPIVGSFDIALAAWLRSYDDIARLESFLRTQFPEVTIVDRSLVLRSTVHLKRDVDADGRGTFPAHECPLA